LANLDRCGIYHH